MSDEFHDPGLKAAVHRCWADERASDLLRARVERACADGRRPNRFAAAGWGGAVAAAAAVAVTVAYLTHRSAATVAVVPPPPPASPAVAALPVWDEVVRTHDQCAAEPNHRHIDAGRGEQDTLIASVLHRQLARPVLVCHPADPGWDFRGAGVCQVGTVPTGHLVFVKDADTLSIFSLPQAVAPGVRDGGEFEMTKGEHRIVGFAERGAVFALVGTGPEQSADLPHLRRMRGRMEEKVMADRKAVPSADPTDVLAAVLPR